MKARVFKSAAELFDGIGADYENAFRHLPEQAAALEWLTARLPNQARVLDIGSGTGRPVAERLTQAGYQVLGIDVSSTMVTLARTQVPGARFEQSDVRTFEAPAASFDAICAFFPLLQMSRTEIDTCLARISSWLVAGGYFVFATVPSDVVDEEVEWMGRRVCVTSHEANHYRECLVANGLNIVYWAESVFRPDGEFNDPEPHLFCYAQKR